MALLSFTVKNYIHKTQPIHQISDAGEIRIEFDKEKDLGRMVFLYDEDANALSIVNNWLIYLKAGFVELFYFPGCARYGLGPHSNL